MHAPACRCQVQSRSGAAFIELIMHAVFLRPGVRLQNVAVGAGGV